MYFSKISYQFILLSLLIHAYSVDDMAVHDSPPYFLPANGAKRRSGRKPGARVTNFVLAELKVVARDR